MMRHLIGLRRRYASERHPMPTDDMPELDRRSSDAASAPRKPRHPLPQREIRYETAETRARYLLQWLQGANGRTGHLPAPELKELYAEMCLQEGLDPGAWAPVGGALRRLIGSPPKRYAIFAGKRVRMWDIPAATSDEN